MKLPMERRDYQIQGVFERAWGRTPTRGCFMVMHFGFPCKSGLPTTLASHVGGSQAVPVPSYRHILKYLIDSVYFTGEKPLML